MNYKEIYKKFINDFKSTDIRERLRRRDIHDNRLSCDEEIYTEIHHILPKSQGGTCDSDNLIELLPEEHIFIHYLRWKCFGDFSDLCAVNFMISGFVNYKNVRVTRIQITKVLKKDFRTKRENFAKFISSHNKNSIAISNARKGKMPVKDAETGAMMGSVSIDHPKVISGEWVHHSTGTKLSEHRKCEMSKQVSGIRNPNSYGITNREYIEQTIEYIIKYGPVFVYKEYGDYCLDNNLIFLKGLSKCRWDGSRAAFMDELLAECEKKGIEVDYCQYRRSEKTKRKISDTASGKKRVYNNDGSYRLEK